MKRKREDGVRTFGGRTWCVVREACVRCLGFVVEVEDVRFGSWWWMGRLIGSLVLKRSVESGWICVANGIGGLIVVVADDGLRHIVPWYFFTTLLSVL